MMRCVSRLALVAVLAGLAGCANEAVWRPVLEQRDAVDVPFTVEGRLSVSLDGKGQLANFDWSHQPPHDELNVKTPLGSTVARLSSGPAGVVLTSDGKDYTANDVDTLTEQQLGFPLPMANLAWWVRGRAAPGIPSETLADGALLQQGWQIRFVRDVDSPSPYPKRIDLVRDRLSLRLVLQNWR